MTIFCNDFAVMCNLVVDAIDSSLLQVRHIMCQEMCSSSASDNDRILTISPVGNIDVIALPPSENRNSML